MARRRHDREEEPLDDEVFKFPDFDRKKFAEEEINRSKAAIVVVMFAAVMGVVSAFVYLRSNPSFAWPLSAMIGIPAFALIKYIYPMVGVKTDLMKKKDYVSHAFIYFLAWLSVFIILMNPPFADYSPPVVEDIHLEGFDGTNWTTYDPALSSNYTEYRIVARAYDNTEVAMVEISTDGGAHWEKMVPIDDGTGRTAYIHPLDYTGGAIPYQIRATDIYGHQSVETGILP